MSYLGRRVVRFDLDARWQAGHRRGKPHPWERSRILKGDYAPIVRDLEPAFDVGQKHILSWSRIRPSFDPQTREVVTPPPEPVFWIEITGKVRRTKGDWSVRFDVFDRRRRGRLVRRKLPGYVHEPDKLGQGLAQTEEEEAREESGYTSNPRAAVDNFEAVDDATLQRFAAEAVAIHTLVEERRGEKAAETRREKHTLDEDLADALREADAKGVDTSSVRFVTERQIARLRRRLDRAA